MRGADERSGDLFSYVDLETRVPAGHRLRAIREIANEALAGMSAEFEALYASTGRPGIAPERLLRALLLQAFYSIRSERRLMQELEFNLLYRWFVGLGIDDEVWDATVFCKNHDRLLAGAVASRFLASLLAVPKVKRLLSGEHFSVDGTLIAAWASIKSFRPRDGSDDGDGAAGTGGRNAEHDFHGAKWSNETHRSITDGDARLYRKGRNKEARLCYLGHAMMENRNGHTRACRLQPDPNTEAPGGAGMTRLDDRSNAITSPANASPHSPPPYRAATEHPAITPKTAPVRLLQQPVTVPYPPA